MIVLSIAVDFSRSRILGRTARKYGSQALEADALHFSTDIWSSGVVLVGLLGILASRKFQIKQLELADSVAALGVAAIVILVTIKLGRRSLDDLLDRVPGDLQARVAAAASVEGVKEVTQVRVRRAGPAFFADVTLLGRSWRADRGRPCDCQQRRRRRAGGAARGRRGDPRRAGLLDA